MKRASGLLFVLLLSACGNKTEGGAPGSSSAAGTSKAAAPGTTAPAANAGGSASTSVLGGADWHAVFIGDPPSKLPTISSGGQGSGVTDDFTRNTPDPGRATPPWKHNEAGGGTIYYSPSSKVVVVTNSNIKIDPTAKTIDTWSKSALIKDLKHTAGPEVLELGPTKAPVLAGAGTCTMKAGDAADVYWWDAHSAGDFSHDLYIVIVSKAASEDEKKVALSVLRGVEYTAKGKPTFKKG